METLIGAFVIVNVEREQESAKHRNVNTSSERDICHSCSYLIVQTKLPDLFYFTELESRAGDFMSSSNN